MRSNRRLAMRAIAAATGTKNAAVKVEGDFATATPLASKSKAELVEIATERGIEGASTSMTKRELLSLLGD